jgi:hypothetical protein
MQEISESGLPSEVMQAIAAGPGVLEAVVSRRSGWEKMFF